MRVGAAGWSVLVVLTDWRVRCGVRRSPIGVVPVPIQLFFNSSCVEACHSLRCSWTLRCCVLAKGAIVRPSLVSNLTMVQANSGALPISGSDGLINSVYGVWGIEIVSKLGRKCIDTG